MRKTSVVAVLLLAGSCLTASAQTGWTPYGSNPVIHSNFDPSATEVYGPCVIKDGSTYRLWYTRKCLPDSEKIGYATSPDGLAWTLIDSAALRPSGGSTLFDRKKVGNVNVIKYNDTLRMWYWGDGPNIGNIGHAWSLDGQHWTKVRGMGTDSSVYDRTQDGGGALALVTPCVIKDGDTLRMWYARGYFSSQLYGRLAYAVSGNGVNWTRVNGPGSNGCVLDAGAAGQFDEFSVLFPSVVKDGAIYRMWYSGQNNAGNQRTGYATSPDGMTWTRHDGGGTGGATINNGITPAVVLDGTSFKMWFNSTDSSNVIYYATAPNTGVAGGPSVAAAPRGARLRVMGATIEYTLAAAGRISLAVYNSAGQRARTIAQGSRGAGVHRAVWDGRNESGERVASGIYLARLVTESGTAYAKLVLVK